MIFIHLSFGYIYKKLKWDGECQKQEVNKIDLGDGDALAICQGTLQYSLRESPLGLTLHLGIKGIGIYN